MVKDETTKMNRDWPPVDAELRRYHADTGATVLTLYRIDSPDTTLVSDIFFEGSDFLWCTKGSFRFEFSDREPLVLHEGEFIVTFPNRFVTIIGLEKSNSLRGGIIIGPKHEEFLLRMGFWDCFVCKNTFSDNNLTTLQDLLNKRSSADETADFALLRFLHFILKSVLISLSVGRSADFYEAVRRINANFLDGSTSLKSLYSEMNCSPPYLIKIFKEHGLHGPSEHLHRLQSWWACRLLTRSRLTIQEIALTCGFSSSSSFARFFRGWMGVSPADVRNGGTYRRRPRA